MVILDRKNKRLIEFNSSPDFSCKTAKEVLEIAEISNYSFEKYFNEDIKLLEQSMTAYQFSQIETKYKKDLKLVSPIVEEMENDNKNHSIDVCLHKPESLDDL